MESESQVYQMAEPHVVYASREGEPLESPKQPMPPTSPSSPEKIQAKVGEGAQAKGGEGKEQEKGEKKVIPFMMAKEKEMIGDLLSWRDPAQTGLLFGAVNIYFILRQLVSDPLHWLAFLTAWLAFPLGYVAKTVLHADQKSPTLDVDAEALGESIMDEMQSLRKTLGDLFTWKSPETSLKVCGVLFLYGAVLRVFGFVISFNILLLMPLLVQHLPVEQIRKVGNFASQKIQTIPMPQMNAILDWSQPKASVAALATANVAVVSAPLLLSYDVMAMGASLAASTLLVGFVLKELRVSGSLPQEAEQLAAEAEQKINAEECQRMMKERVNMGIQNFQQIVHKGYELLTWKQPKLSLVAFTVAILATSLMTIVGTIPMALLAVNAAAIISHPAISEKIKAKVQ